MAQTPEREGGRESGGRLGGRESQAGVRTGKRCRESRAECRIYSNAMPERDEIKMEREVKLWAMSHTGDG